MTPGGMLPLNNMPVDKWKGTNAKGSVGDGTEGLFSIKAFIDQLVPQDNPNNPAVDKGESFLETQGLTVSEAVGLLRKKINISSENDGGGEKPLSISDGDFNKYSRMRNLSGDMIAVEAEAFNAAEEGAQIHPNDKTQDQKADKIKRAEKRFSGGGRGYLRKALKNQPASGHLSENKIVDEGSKKKALRVADNKQAEKLKIDPPNVAALHGEAAEFGSEEPALDRVSGKLKIDPPNVAALHGEAAELGSEEPALDRVSGKEKIELSSTGLRNKAFSRQLFQDVDSKRYFDYRLEKKADVELNNKGNALKPNINPTNTTPDQLEKSIDAGRENPYKALKSVNYALNITQDHPIHKSVRKLYERKKLDVESDHKLSRVMIGDNKKNRLSRVNRKRGKNSLLTWKMGAKPSPSKDVLPETRLGNEINQKEMSIKSSADVSLISRTGSTAKSDSSVENSAELNSKVLSNVEGKLIEQIEITKSDGAGGKETEIKMKLFPPELGELKLTVLIKEGKRIRASFVTDTASAGNIINGGAERLSEVISRHGFVLENLDVSVGNPDDNAEKGEWENFSEASDNSEFNKKSNEKRIPIAKPVEDGINLLV